jgi:hypothetical protein
MIVQRRYQRRLRYRFAMIVQRRCQHLLMYRCVQQFLPWVPLQELPWAQLQELAD